MADEAGFIQTVSHEDNGPLMTSVTWVLCALAGIFLGLRLYAKCSRRHPLWWDDYILIFSWIILLIEAIATQIAISIGFGKHTRDISLINIFILAVGLTIGTTLTCFASTFSKISFGVTLLRLTTGHTRAFVWFVIVTLFLVMLPSAFISYVTCRPLLKLWNPTIEGECFDAKRILRYGYFNAAWCACADFALALLPWKLIWGLQLKVREKIGVSIAMSMGLLAGICAIVKGVFIGQIGQDDFTYNGKDVMIWTAAETATAIIGASIPVLRVFFKETISSHSQSQSHTTGTGIGSDPSTTFRSNTTKRRSTMQFSNNSQSMGLRTSVSCLDDQRHDFYELSSLRGDTESSAEVEYVMDQRGRIVPVSKMGARTKVEASVSGEDASEYAISPIQTTPVNFPDWRQDYRRGADDASLEDEHQRIGWAR
ncbi:unnamed protein product [Periconia digitata]|uniref:Rhodopsin domain-containing protein n=1 Tax=Periconia digitata TaxID=1303443 RepID=A0A9W4UFH3_9PLEO|nr:unnamed protein product [Periconia digitata]